MEQTNHWIIVACWGIFIAYWAVSAVRGKRTVERQSFWMMLTYRLPLVLGWVMLVSSRVPGQGRVLPHTPAMMTAGALVCVLGLGVTIWARRTLAGNWSSEVTFKQDHELIRTGPYQFARHPIYTGLLVMCLGSAMDLGRLRCLIGLLLVGIGFWIKLNHEERLLLRHFPEAYPQYRKTVKALVPWIL